MVHTYSCTDCKNELTPGSSFCDNCGSSVAATLWKEVNRLEDQIADLEKKASQGQKKRRRVSRRQAEKILADRFSGLYRKGMNDREIAKAVKLTPSAVYRYRRRLKLPANAPRGFQKSAAETSEKKAEGKSGGSATPR